MAKGTGPVAPADASDVGQLEAELAGTRARLTRSLAAVEMEVCARLDPTAPAHTLSRPRDPTDIALLVLWILRGVRRFARASSTRFKGIRTPPRSISDRHDHA